MISTEYQVLEMERKHIPGVVEAYLASFPVFFLTFLGSDFV